MTWYRLSDPQQTHSLGLGLSTEDTHLLYCAVAACFDLSASQGQMGATYAMPTLKDVYSLRCAAAACFDSSSFQGQMGATCAVPTPTALEAKIYDSGD